MKLWVARFWSKVKVTDDDDLCWFWRGTRTDFGYGTFTVSENGSRHIVDAHVLAYTLHHGAIPDGLLVLHRCNRHACCNPKHLYAGTQIDNMRDRRARSGGRYGGGASRKLTYEKELMLRTEFKAGVKQHALAYKYGVSDSTVSRILHDPIRKLGIYKDGPKGVR